MLATVAVRAMQLTLPLIPGSAVPAIAQLIGSLTWLSSPRARAAVRENQLVAAPGRRPEVRRTFVNQVRNYLDTFRLFSASREEVAQWVGAEGWEHFLAAHARGKGVVMASAHFGPMNVCGQLFLVRGYPTTMPVEEERSEFGRAVNRARSALGGTFIPTSSARGIYRVLRDGGVLGVIADRAVTGTGERVEFFGHHVLLPSAHIALALRADASVVPAFAYRHGHKVSLHFEPALNLARTGDHEADVRLGMREFTRVMERHIAGAPEEWAVFDRFFPPASVGQSPPSPKPFPLRWLRLLRSKGPKRLG